MRSRWISLILLTGLLLGLLVLPALARPQAAPLPDAYDLTWNTLDGGGGETTSSTGTITYTLNTTIGQPDAVFLTGFNIYTLSGGFWYGAGLNHRISLPVVLRN